MGKKSILVGPFLGEFGWELFAWQAHWRWHSREGTYNKIFVQCRPGREALYADYAIMDRLPSALGADGSVVRGLKVFPSNKEAVPYLPDCSLSSEFQKQVFIRYGVPAPDAPDVIFHARNRQHRNKENWEEDRVAELAARLRKQGLSVGFIGVSTEAFDPDPGSKFSFLDVPLERLFTLLAGSRCIVGTSSGPLHLASLCGCPQVIFSSGRNHRRYKKDWNPFDIPVAFPPGKWQPTVEDAYKATMDMLDGRVV